MRPERDRHLQACEDTVCIEERASEERGGMPTSRKATWARAPSRTVLLATFTKLPTPPPAGNLAPPGWQGVWPIVFPSGNSCLLKAHMHLLFPRLRAL